MNNFEGPKSPPERKESGSKFRNFLEDFEGTYNAILQFEGFPANPTTREDKVTLMRFRSMLESEVNWLREAREAAKKKGMSEDDMAFELTTGFEGFAGFNRYEIRGDGVVSLSELHLTGGRDKAKELGLAIRRGSRLLAE